jgi:hypothetical protein
MDTDQDRLDLVDFARAANTESDGREVHFAPRTSMVDCQRFCRSRGGDDRSWELDW